jgi:hypothetical protein
MPIVFAIPGNCLLVRKSKPLYIRYRSHAGEYFLDVERRDVEAAVHARKELGRDYDEEIVDSLLAKLDKRLEERRQPLPAEHRGAITPLALGLAGCGVAATAILATHGSAWLVPVVWIAIAWAIGQLARYR